MFLLFSIKEFFAADVIGPLFGGAVASTYNMMMELNNLFVNNDLIKAVSGSVYTVVGIFVLFRTFITMLNYLVDPDKVSDKQVGAGKMIMRIVVSLALLLTLNSFIFPLLNNVQTMILQSNILAKIVSVNKDSLGDDSITNDSNTNSSNTNTTSNNANDSTVITGVDKTKLEIENGFSCSYVFHDVNSNIANMKDDGAITCNSNYDKAKNNEIILVFEKSNDENLMFKDKNKYNITLYNKDLEKGYLSILDGSIRESNYWNNDSIKDLDKGICPNSIVGLKCVFNETGSISCSANKDVIFTTESWENVDNNASEYGLTNYGKYQWQQVSSKYSKDLYNNVCPNDVDVKKDLDEAISNGYLSSGVVNGCEGKICGTQFSKLLMDSFITLDSCEENSDCRSAYDNYLYSAKDNTAFGKQYKKGNVTIDVLMSVLFGIGAIILIFTICIEVVVRNLKLWVLQLISPIVVVNYMNPSDKMFGKWIKMYFSAYCDLFLKLFAIYAGETILMVIINTARYTKLGFGKVFFVGGILVFIKVIPNLLSELFGTNNKGTFKESFGIIKSLGAGAGALAGASAYGARAIAATRGQSFGNKMAATVSALATAGSSTVRGLYYGYKGNVIKGYDYAKNTNVQRRELYESGTRGIDVLGNTFAFGLYDPNRRDERVEGAYDAILKEQKTMDTRIEDEILKKNHYGMKQMRDNLALMRATSKDDKGNAVTTEDIAAYDKKYNDLLAANKGRYIKDVLEGNIDDAQTMANAHSYDRIVKFYSKNLGKHTDHSDKAYSYDFTELQTIDKVVKSVGVGSIDDQAKGYKKTKSIAEDSKITFSGSDTRATHYKSPKKDKK